MDKNDKFRMSVLKMWIWTMRMIYWLVIYCNTSGTIKEDAKMTANQHIHRADEQVEWWLTHKD